MTPSSRTRRARSRSLQVLLDDESSVEMLRAHGYAGGRARRTSAPSVGLSAVVSKVLFGSLGARGFGLLGVWCTGCIGEGLVMSGAESGRFRCGLWLSREGGSALVFNGETTMVAASARALCASAVAGARRAAE